MQRSNKELQEFAHIASHDLQEPLRKFAAFGNRLKTRRGEALGDQGNDYLERMQNAIERMRTLINGLLIFSQVHTKGQPFALTDLGVSLWCGIAVVWRLLRGKSPAGTERRKPSGADPAAHPSAKAVAASRIDDPSSTENPKPEGLAGVWPFSGGFPGAGAARIFSQIKLDSRKSLLHSRKDERNLQVARTGSGRGGAGIDSRAHWVTPGLASHPDLPRDL